MGKQIPTKKLTRGGKCKSRALCDECKKEFRVRNLILFKGKHLCYLCKSKMKSCRLQTSAQSLLCPTSKKVPLEKALQKVYTPKSYYTKKGSKICLMSLPSCFGGKKIKITIVEEEKE